MTTDIESCEMAESYEKTDDTHALAPVEIGLFL